MTLVFFQIKNLQIFISSELVAEHGKQSLHVAEMDFHFLNLKAEILMHLDRGSCGGTKQTLLDGMATTTLVWSIHAQASF